MKHTNEEIINALKIIKDECKACGKCEECPFQNSETERCMLLEYAPCEWKLNKPEPETWRAFK